MKISKITLNNFRPFYGSTSVDLTTSQEKNIVLIGGKNGQGKTNFLLSVVWCLYGENIGKVDDSFKAEISNNYPKFLDGVLNKDKKKEYGTKFSVEILCEQVSYGDENQKSTITIERKYDIKTQDENLRLTSDNDELLLATSTKEERQDFINDYLIPIEIARFVFFDAEKISQIADLNSAQQAKLMNQTLGNMLGLNIYQSLSDDIQSYIKGLKKESSTYEIQEQINNFENALKQADQSIENKKNALENNKKQVKGLEVNIEDLEIQINRKGGDNTDIESLHKERRLLKDGREKAQLKFNNMVDIIPLIMLSGLMQETKEHIEVEEEIRENESARRGFSSKLDSFIEGLFNEGNRPNPDISFKQKIFYEEKSKQLANRLNDGDECEEYELPFKHNLDPSKIKNLQENYKKLRNKSNTDFFATIEEFTKEKRKLSKLEAHIRKLELISADDLTKSLMDDKDDCKKSRDRLVKKTGSIESEISTLENHKANHKKRLSSLYEAAKVNTENQKRVNLSEKYIDVLTKFIKEEKESKKETIKNKLLDELKILWDKDLVTDANLEILPADKGMEVELLDINNKKIDSKELSKGEQQLYISALLKAILDSSIHDLPVFIDTPLARLDSSHRDNILQHYYPNLSNQVVVFSTDTEITNSRYEDIRQHTIRSYLIKNENGKSSINKGYFD